MTTLSERSALREQLLLGVLGCCALLLLDAPMRSRSPVRSVCPAAENGPTDQRKGTKPVLFRVRPDTAAMHD